MYIIMSHMSYILPEIVIAGDKELLECMTALQQSVDLKELCQLVTSSMNKSTEVLEKITMTMNGEHQVN